MSITGCADRFRKAARFGPTKVIRMAARAAARCDRIMVWSSTCPRARPCKPPPAAPWSPRAADAETVYGPHTNFYGNLIIISSDSTYDGLPVYTVYGHLSQIFVNEGQHVEAEEIIALSGATGVADGPHLHFEVRVGQNSEDNTRNPLLWLYPFPDHGTIAGRVTWPSGELAHGVQLFARRVDASSKYAETTSYANETGELNGDDGWQENFAFDDVLAGYYEVEARRGKREV